MENKDIQKSGTLGSITLNKGGNIEVHPKHPITGKKMNVEIEPLKESDYSIEKINEDLSKYGLTAVEKVEVVNPITKEKSLVTIDRTGTHEGKLAIRAAEYTRGLITRDQFDSTVSLYLFERGKEGLSMLTDLYQYKGQHTRETRSFMSQARFDYEVLVKRIAEQMRAVARDVAKLYNVIDIPLFCSEYLREMEEARKEDRTPNLRNFFSAWGDSIADVAHLITMIRNWTEADRLESDVKRVTQARERERGHGIYIDRSGKPYSIYEDNNIEDVVRDDKARIAELNEEEKKL